ncbi:MAG TPA: hypothetical protein VFZ95_12955 [Steroidobacteraceae bacterium]
MKGSLPRALFLVGLLAGCATPMSSAVSEANKQLELKGSPFRYRAVDDSHMTLTLMPLPAGPSKAVPVLAGQAMESITTQEMRKGRSVANLEEVRHLQDGREVWVLKTLGGGVAYIVAFASPSQPGTDIRITGPTTYQK